MNVGHLLRRPVAQCGGSGQDRAGGERSGGHEPSGWGEQLAWERACRGRDWSEFYCTNSGESLGGKRNGNLVDNTVLQWLNLPDTYIVCCFKMSKTVWDLRH